VLWLFMAVAMSAHGVLGLFEARIIEKITSGEMQMSAGMFLLCAVCWLIPLTMAVLCVALKERANRWSNLILAAIFTVLNVYHFIGHLAEPSVHQLLIIFATVVVTALTFLYALRWPGREGTAHKQRGGEQVVAPGG